MDLHFTLRIIKEKHSFTAIIFQYYGVKFLSSKFLNSKNYFFWAIQIESINFSMHQSVTNFGHDRVNWPAFFFWLPPIKLSVIFREAK